MYVLISDFNFVCKFLQCKTMFTISCLNRHPSALSDFSFVVSIIKSSLGKEVSKIEDGHFKNFPRYNWTF